VVVFSAFVVAHGMLVAALAARYSDVLPLVSNETRSIIAHAPLLLIAPAALAAVPLAVVGAVAVLAARFRPLVVGLSSRRTTAAGRVVLAVVVVVALPGFVSSVTDILGRGP
jgi:hypothetical protein